MRLSILLCVACLLHVAPVSAEEGRKRSAGETVAAAYFDALIGGDVEKADALATVPYSFDRKEVLTEMAQVKEKHRAIVGKKGKRKVPEYTVSVPTDAPELDRKVFPAYLVFRIAIVGDDEYVDIYVTKGDAPKVMGFSD